MADRLFILWGVARVLAPLSPTMLLPTSLVGVKVACSTVTCAQYSNKSAGTTGPEEARARNPNGGDGAEVVAAILSPSPSCHSSELTATRRPPGDRGGGNRAERAVFPDTALCPTKSVLLAQLRSHVAGIAGPSYNAAAGADTANAMAHDAG